jgi:hypothetical protein
VEAEKSEIDKVGKLGGTDPVCYGLNVSIKLHVLEI